PIAASRLEQMSAPLLLRCAPMVPRTSINRQAEVSQDNEPKIPVRPMQSNSLGKRGRLAITDFPFCYSKFVSAKAPKFGPDWHCTRGAYAHQRSATTRCPRGGGSLNFPGMTIVPGVAVWPSVRSG